MADLEKNGQPYAFFPLHAEPEIATSVLARNYMNQIEAVRNIAHSLPMGMRLMVKEHPRSWGLRTPGYYRRLSEIPNVVFVDVDESTDRVVRSAAVVVVLSGFIGFEAALAGVPVVVLGRSFVTYLPPSMVRKVDALDGLPQAMQDLMQNYAVDEDALTALVAAIIADAVPANLWSELLGKAGREHGTAAEGADRSQQEQIRLMAEYLLRRLHDPRLGEFQVAP
ncbi:MAG: hypothetical protein EPO32_05135 [Anaerolineae bacterium]|nr:MAG: hypothetical protein EPO32_05135 [Anaerolineae bacterium]